MVRPGSGREGERAIERAGGEAAGGSKWSGIALGLGPLGTEGTSMALDFLAGCVGGEKRGGGRGLRKKNRTEYKI